MCDAENTMVSIQPTHYVAIVCCFCFFFEKWRCLQFRHYYYFHFLANVLFLANTLAATTAATVAIVLCPFQSVHEMEFSHNKLLIACVLCCNDDISYYVTLLGALRHWSKYYNSTDRRKSFKTNVWFFVWHRFNLLLHASEIQSGLRTVIKFAIFKPSFDSIAFRLQ